MKELQVFKNDAFKVRAIEKDGNFWFIASDVAEILDYRMASDMTRILDEEEKGTHIIHTHGGNQSVTMINESGVFSAILKSRKPEAKAFKKWVTSEVLPTIRKTGGYLNPKIDWTDLDNIQKVIDVAKEERSKRIKLEEEARQNAPKLEFYENVSSTEKTISFREFGRITGLGEKKVFKLARELKLIDAQNKAYQRYIDEGFFELKEKMTKIADHDVIYFQTRITGKGQAWLLKKIKENMPA